MKKIVSIALLASTLFGCSKGSSGSATDYSGKYEGSTTQTTNNITQPYNMVIDISNGDNSSEIKILFGNWLTKATLTGSKFIIKETTFTGSIVTTGNGEFIAGNKVSINYNQKIGSSSTANYSGVLTKF